MEMQVNDRRVSLSTFEENPLAKDVLNSLFSWRKPADGDDVQGGIYGWWGDTYAAVRGDVFGSRLWEIMRSKVTLQTLKAAETYAKEALKYLIDDGVVQSIEVKAGRGAQGRVDLDVRLYKPDQTKLDIRFQDVWEKVA